MLGQTRGGKERTSNARAVAGLRAAADAGVVSAETLFRPDAIEEGASVTSSSDTLAADSTRELAAIMFSDIVGYTALMGRDEQLAMRALAAHRELLRTILPHFNGRLIGEIGDGTLSSFHSAFEAVNCACEIQASLASDTELRIRIGIHVGTSCSPITPCWVTALMSRRGFTNWLLRAEFAFRSEFSMTSATSLAFRRKTLGRRRSRM